MDVPGAADAVPDGDRREGGLGRRAAGHPGWRRPRTAGKALNIVYLTGKGSLDERSKLVDSMRAYVGDNPPPPGVKVTPSGLAVVGVGLLDNLESNRILLTYLAHRRSSACSWRSGCASVIRSLLSLVPVLIAVGLASLVAWALSPDAEPDDRGRRAAGDRGVHRVHVADPAAVRRGARPGLEPQGGGRRGRGPHRPGLHRVGAHRDRRRGRAVVLVAAAAARLRPRSWR